jgi:RimJ/RimL family protein N-acetyltransferase
MELAFDGLGAHTALSGALVHSLASQRVSKKLGYSCVGTREIAPRGEPVLHYDYRLERPEFRCPIPVEIHGVEPALALFGAGPSA